MDDHAKRWRANVFLTEDDGETEAHAVLDTGTETVHGKGAARRNPADSEIERVGAELAAGRALIALGRRLLGLTEQDIEAVEGHEVHVAE